MEAPIQQDSTEVQAGIPPAPQTTDIPNGYQPPSVTPAPVESGQSTRQEPAPGTSEFETARQLKNLMKEFRSLKQSFETRSSVQTQGNPQTPSIPQVTREELLNDPLSGIRRIAQSEILGLKEEFPKMLQQRETEWKHEQARQEGLRLIDTNELVKKDPEGREKIDSILLEEDENGNSLQKYSFTNPRHAAQLALKEYQNRYGNSRPTFAPSKAQMQSTATSQTSGAGRTNTAQQIETLYKQLADYPDLMKDKEFMAKINAVTKQHDVEARAGA